MKRILAALALLLQGGVCVHANRIAVTASVVALGCDWKQTRGWAGRKWPENSKETNPLMGEYPTTGIVDGYFAIAAASTVLLWSVLPRRWRIVVPLFVLAVQAQAVVRTIHNGTGTVCAL
jgi:hypothetical protein